MILPSRAADSGPVTPAARVLLLALPTLATLAWYLPGGLFMPARLVIVALAGLAGWQLVRDPQLLRSRVVQWSAIASVVILGSGALALVRYGGHLISLVQFAFALLACCALAVLGRNKGTVAALLWGWLISAGIAATVGFWEIATARHLPGNAPARRFAGVVPGWNVISSFFDNPNLYAYHCTAVLLLLPALYQIARRRAWKVVVLASAPLIFVLLLWTSGRLALIALAVGLVGWAIKEVWARWLIGLGAAGVLGTMALNLPPGAQVLATIRMLIENLRWGELTSSGARLELIRAALWMSEQSSFLGVGPGRFPDLARDKANPHVAEFTNPHFGLTELLAEYGTVALLALLASLIAGLVVLFRRFPKCPELRCARSLRVAGGALILALPVLSATHSTWLSQPLTAVHLATIAGLVALAAVPKPSGPDE